MNYKKKDTLKDQKHLYSVTKVVEYDSKIVESNKKRDCIPMYMDISALIEEADK